MEDHKPDNQITQWLKKLQRESWQLELLVSAFTIFLLNQAWSAFDVFLDGLPYKYNLNAGFLTFIFFFLGLLGQSIKALIIFLVVHLMLRGFWIGTIGLRSVQSTIDFSKLNYSTYFTDKLQKRIVSLDNLVVKLDEICSVIFSFSFLFISILISFGLYLLFIGAVLLILISLEEITPGSLSIVFNVISITSMAGILLTGILYLVDYFTLGFIKKIRIISKLYYPIYRFYGVITLSVISRSIYYYLISKFSKRRIRIVYLFIGIVIMVNWFIDFDQYQYFPDSRNNLVLDNDYYDNMRKDNDYVNLASIESNVVREGYFQLFIRYDPADNPVIRHICPDFEPKKNDGVNPAFQLKVTDGNLFISDRKSEEEDKDKLLECLSALYEISINDSTYKNTEYYFFEHPQQNQPGLVTMVPTKNLPEGENILQIKKAALSAPDSLFTVDYAYIPFWFVKE